MRPDHMDRQMPDFGGIPRILHRDDGGTVLCVQKPDGEITMTRYCVFPGIELIYNDIHARKSAADISGSRRNLLEIDHCRDGRIENEIGIVNEALKEIGTTMIQYVPRSAEIQEAENQGGTVFEFLTDSKMQAVYSELADKIIAQE